MTSTQPGQPGRKPSRGYRAAGAAALIAVTGLAGWAVVAGSLAPAAEPMSRSMQANRPSMDPADTSRSASPGPTSPGPTVPGSASSESASSVPASPDAPAPKTTPVPAEKQSPASEEPAPGRPDPDAAPPAPGPPDPGAKDAAPPAGKIINEPPPVAKAKGFEKQADVAEGVATKVKAMKAVNGEARGVGEVSGPAVQFTLEVTNSTKEPISLAEAVVNVEAGADRFPAEELSGPGVIPFPPEVAPGQKVSGVFVFQIPPEQRKTVRVLFHYQAVSPVAAFEGSVPVQGEAP